MNTSPSETYDDASWPDAIRDARRERIIDAASRVFAEAGLDGASVRKIAAAAGCTTGAIYPLFESKEAIYAELLMRSLRELRRRVSDVIVTCESAEDRIRRGAFCTLDFYLERPEEFAISFYLSAGLKRKGVGNTLNEKLNAELLDLNALLNGEWAGIVGEEEAARSQTNLFAHITGLVVLQLRGRFSVFAGDTHSLLRDYLDAMLGPAT